MSLQSNKCLRFFRKYILYNTKIIFGPKNQEITNLHLLFFYKVNLMEFWIPPWELCWAQGPMWVLNAGTPSWRELTPPAAQQGHSSPLHKDSTGGVTGPALPHCSCHCSSKGAGTSPQRKPQSDPSSRPGKVQGFERYQIQKPKEAPELWPHHNEPRSTAEDLPAARDRTLLQTPWDPILLSAFSTNSTDPLESCSLHFSRGAGFILVSVWDVWGFFGFVWFGFAWGFLQSLFKLLWWQFTVPDWVCLCYF